MGRFILVKRPSRHFRFSTARLKPLVFFFNAAEKNSALTFPQSLEALRGVDTLIIDALRHTPHSTHMNFEETLAVQREIQPRQTWFTHIQCEIMHAVEDPKLPTGVNIAYDGLKLEWK